MLFNSYEFLFVFLPVTLAGCAGAAYLNGRLAIAWLVIASLFFYGWWNPAYVWLIAGSVGVNYGLGRALNKLPSRWLLAFGVALNFGVIGYFKYAGFFAEIAQGLTGQQVSVGDILLPLGISFFTFQQIAYLVDCFKGRVNRHGWLEYGLFVTFFPQLIAGPIVNQREILWQLDGGIRRLNLENLAVGMTIIALGLFKKVVIADTMATFANPVFSAAGAGDTIGFLEGWTGAFSYTFQLYFDFSGYSDMAIGLARLFGIRLPVNFNSPYKATSIIDFWRRWHITLSRFLKNYLYFPLGGNRKGTRRRTINVITVMLLGGLWHGAGWTFIFWGGLHGAYLLANHAWRNARPRLGLGDRPSAMERTISWALTFLAVVVAWVFFRAENWSVALNILYGMSGLGADFNWGSLIVFEPKPLLVFLNNPYQWLTLSSPFFGIYQIVWLLAAFIIVLIMPNTQEWMSRWDPALDVVRRPRGIFHLLLWQPNRRWAVAVGVMLIAVVLGMQRPMEFLYYQF